MNPSAVRSLCACALGAALLSCATPARPKPAVTTAKPAAPPPPAPKPLSAYERRWQSACEAHGALGRCPAPFNRPGLFLDVQAEGERPPPGLCGVGEPVGDDATRAALRSERRALRACLRAAEPGAFVDIELGGARAPGASPGVSARAVACAAKIVQRASASAAPSAVERVVVMNGGSAGEAATNLSKDNVHAVIAAHADEVSACYDGALEVWPGLRGRLAPSVVVWFDGSVALVRTADSSLDNAALECCINTAVRGWRFEPPADGTIAIVTLPLVLGPEQD